MTVSYKSGLMPGNTTRIQVHAFSHTGATLTPKWINPLTSSIAGSQVTDISALRNRIAITGYFTRDLFYSTAAINLGINDGIAINTVDSNLSIDSHCNIGIPGPIRTIPASNSCTPR